MIEELKLITRSKNKVSYPNAKWERLEKIYVTGILSLGLSDKVHFNQDNCPTLLAVIKLIHCIGQNIISEFKFSSKEGRIIIENGEETLIRIYKCGFSGTKRLIIEKRHYSKLGIDKMSESIWKQMEPLNRKLRNQIATRLCGVNSLKQNEKGIRLGDKVRTTPYVETSREGLVSWIGNHKKDEIMKEFTTIVIKGHQHNRRYESFELSINE